MKYRITIYLAGFHLDRIISDAIPVASEEEFDKAVRDIQSSAYDWGGVTFRAESGSIYIFPPTLLGRSIIQLSMER